MSDNSPSLLLLFHDSFRDAGVNYPKEAYFTKDVIKLGRDYYNDVVFKDTLVSRNHASLTYDSGLGAWFIEDTNSQAGVILNGQRIEKKSLLNNGDEFYLGQALAKVLFITGVGKNSEKTFQQQGTPESRRFNLQGQIPPHLKELDPKKYSFDTSRCLLILAYDSYRKIGELKAKEFYFNTQTIKIGRNILNDVVLNSSTVSLTHAILLYDPEQKAWTLQDLNSRYGVFLNGTKIDSARLKNGDELYLGEALLKVVFDRLNEEEAEVIKRADLKDLADAPTTTIDYFQQQHRKSPQDSVLFHNQVPEHLENLLHDNESSMTNVPEDGQARQAGLLLQAHDNYRDAGELRPKEFLICSDVATIGRHYSSDVVLNSETVSTKHAQLSYHADKKAWFISDLASHNGIVINHKKIESAELKHGDEIFLGEALLTVKLKHLNVDKTRSFVILNQNKYAGVKAFGMLLLSTLALLSLHMATSYYQTEKKLYDEWMGLLISMITFWVLAIVISFLVRKKFNLAATFLLIFKYISAIMLYLILNSLIFVGISEWVGTVVLYALLLTFFGEFGTLLSTRRDLKTIWLRSLALVLFLVSVQALTSFQGPTTYLKIPYTASFTGTAPSTKDMPQIEKILDELIGEVKAEYDEQ